MAETGYTVLQVCPLVQRAILPNQEFVKNLMTMMLVIITRTLKTRRSMQIVSLLAA